MYNKKEHIHFVGIGGIGMSGIAKILRAQGYRISGCDLDLAQKSVRDLVADGCTIHEGNNTPACHDSSVDVLVYSSAIQHDNPEITAARQRGIPTIPRALMLAELMRTKYSIAIAGAHGKTTTTSMIAHILIEAHYDPTVVVGGHLATISTNARLGEGDFLVAETDESDKSLLRLYPSIAVVTNIDAEHLDVYRDLDDVKDTFLSFLSNLPFYGKAVMCVDDAHIRSILPLPPHIKTTTYGMTPDADWYATDCILEKEYSTARIWQKGSVQPLGILTVPMPGRHNLLNALAAVAVCHDLGASFATIAGALATFKGVDRRFTFRGTYQGADVFDDYGHHPTEIYNTLLIAKKRSRGKLIVAFQPHRYTRTQKLWNDFVAVLSSPIIDHLIMTEIYAASEAPIAGVTGKTLFDAINAARPQGSTSFVPLNEAPKIIADKADDQSLILLQGAGKITTLSEKLTAQ